MNNQGNNQQGGRGRGRGRGAPAGAGRGVGGRGRGGRGAGGQAPPAPQPQPFPQPLPAAFLNPFLGQPPVPAVINPRESVASVMDRAVRDYVPRVHADDVDAVTSALGINVVTMQAGAMGRNPHAVLAVVRSMASVWSLARLISLGHRFIDARWGNWRDMGVLAYLNAALARAGYGDSLAPYVQMALMDGWVTPSDIHRRPFIGPNRDLATAAFFMDVYYIGGTGEQPRVITPGAIAALGYQHVIWAGHCFNDLFGTVGGAVWLRTGDMIEWCPDPVNPPYPKHDACDAMHVEGSITGFAWAPAKTWSLREGGVDTHVYNAMEFVPTPDGARLPVTHGSVPSSQGMVVKLNIPDTEAVIRAGAEWYLDFIVREVAHWWATYVDIGLPRKVVYVRRAHLRLAQDYLSSRKRTALVLMGLKKEIDRFLGLDRAYQEVARRYPLQFTNYRRDLALAAMTFGAEGDASMALAVRASNASFFQLRNESEAHLDVPMAGLGWKWYVLGAAVLLCLYKLRPAVMASVGLPKINVQIAVPQTGIVRKVVDRVKGWYSTLHWGAKVYDQWTSAKAGVPTIGAGRVLFDTCIVAPLVEEGFKWLFRNRPLLKLLVCLGITAGDYSRDVSGHKHPGLLIYRVLAQVFRHYAVSCLPYRWAVLLHGLYNARTIHDIGAMVSPSEVVAGVVAGAEWVQPFANLIPDHNVVMTGWNSWLAAAFSALSFTDRPVRQFDQHYYRDNGEFVFDDTVAISKLGDNVYVPASNCLITTLPAADPTVRLSGPLDFPEPDRMEERGGYWRIIGHNAPMWKPANSPCNAQRVVTHRLAKAIDFHSTDDWWYSTLRLFVKANRAHQRSVLVSPRIAPLAAHAPADWHLLPLGMDFTSYDVSFAFGIVNPWDGWDGLANDTEEIRKWWLEHVDPSKRKRYLSAFEANDAARIDRHSKLTRGVQVNIKCDEVLLKHSWVPRPIHAVDPRVAVTLGPAVYAATMKIKPHYWFMPILHASLNAVDTTVTVTYGAGLTASQLSHWFMSAIDVDGLHIIAAGDDSVAVQTTRTHLRFFEGDISQNDHSVRTPALRFEWAILRAAGVPDEEVAMLEVNARAPCVVSRGGDTGSVTVFREAERNTGGVDTTVGNTLVTLGAWISAINAVVGGALEAFHVIGGFAQAGLALKMRETGGARERLGVDYFPPSFLKGTWYLAADNMDVSWAGRPVASNVVSWVWGPLLGRFLKVLKTMSNPVHTQHLPGEAPISLHEALGRQLVSVAKSMLSFVMPEQLRAWLLGIVSAHPLADRIRASTEDIADPWRPRGDCLVTLADPHEQIAEWYGVDAQFVQGFFDHVVQLRVGDFSQHPMWSIMAMRDYN